MKSLVLAAALAAALAGPAFGQGSDSSMMMKSGNSSANGSMMKSSGAGTGSSAAGMPYADPTDSTMFNLKGLGTQVLAFTSEQDAWALAKSRTVIYFFAATWCPNCLATYKDLQANFASIPANVDILFVDYDKAKDLKVKYGIAVQHTFVVVGPDGSARKTWAGTSTVADILGAALAM